MASWIESVPVCEPLYEHFVDYLRERGAEVKTRGCSALTEVQLTNCGPSTALMDSTELSQLRA